jgi:hypothetical protein
MLAKKSSLKMELPTDSIDYYFAVLDIVMRGKGDLSTAAANPASGAEDQEEAGNAMLAEPTPKCTQQSQLSELLTAFRMACTNVPIDSTLLNDTQAALDAQLLREFGPEVLDSISAKLNKTQSQRSEIEKLPLYKQQGMYQKEMMQCIVPGLYVGSYHPAADREVLDREKITHILCCIDVQPRFPQNYKYLVLAAADANGYNMAQHFSKTNKFIRDAIENGGNVLVHCGAGISRAPTVAAAYLISTLKVSSGRAVALIKKYRPCAQPNLGFTAQLNAYSEFIQTGKKTYFVGGSVTSSE